MSKSDRLQLRMNPELKEWFDEYAEPRGGMSKVVHGHVEELYEKETGKPWTSEDPDGSSAKEDGAGDGGAGDPQVHRPRTP